MLRVTTCCASHPFHTGWLDLLVRGPQLVGMIGQVRHTDELIGCLHMPFNLTGYNILLGNRG